MLPASRALVGKGSAGDILPDVFPQLTSYGIHFRRSQMSMVVAGPGVGKSVFAVLLAVKMNVPTLYMSADTDAHTTNVRLAAAITGERQEAIDEAIRAGGSYADHIDTVADLQFSFDSSPSIDDIVAEVDAFAMLYGEYPHFIVVDNLKNLYFESDNEFSAYAAILDELHQLARLTTAHIMVLHHATGQYEDGNTAIPLSGLTGKVGKIPELVLTLYRVHDSYIDSLGVSPVKHRNGQADASGKTALWFGIDLSRMHLGEPTPLITPPPPRWEPD